MPVYIWDKGKVKRKKPWKARTSIRGVRIFLGYYETKEEAAQEEKEFRQAYREQEVS